MKTLLAAAALSLLIAAPLAAEVHGAWTAESEGSGKVQFNLARHNNHFGETMNVADFAGLSPAAVDATTQTPVNFELRREAGIVAFEGSFRNGDGAGQFTFTPNPSYASAMRSMGVTFGDEDALDDSHLLTMAMIDVSTAYIRSLQAEGYKETGNEYVEMAIFKVTPDYIRQMRAAGYSDLTAQQLVESRIHKATPEFISQMKAAGYSDLPFRQLIEFRIFKVTPEFIRDLKDAGYENVPARKLIEMKIHGITPEYIRKMNAAK